MNADGTNERRLTRNQARDRDPAWSPDGRRIAFTRARYRLQQEKLVVIDVETHERMRVAISPAFELEPDWQPL